MEIISNNTIKLDRTDFEMVQAVFGIKFYKDNGYLSEEFNKWFSKYFNTDKLKWRGRNLKPDVLSHPTPDTIPEQMIITFCYFKNSLNEELIEIESILAKPDYEL